MARKPKYGKNTVSVLLAAVVMILVFSSPGGAIPSPAVYELKKSVVRITCPVRDGVLSGTGFAIGKTSEPVKYIVTNWHVVYANPGRVKVLISRDNLIDTEVKLRLPLTDIAVLELKQPLNIPPVTFGDPEQTKDGQTVYALGFPGDADLESFSGSPDNITLTTGTVSKIGSLDGVKIIQTDAAINYGSSGGPLVNEEAQVIGISYRKSSAGEGLGLAININELLPQLDALGIPYQKFDEQPGQTAADAAVPNPAPNESAEPGQGQDPLPNPSNGLQKQNLVIGLVAILIVGGAAVLLTTRRRRVKPQTGAMPLAVDEGQGLLAGVKKPTLRGIAGFFAGNVVELGSQSIAIGRDPDHCQLVYPQSSEEISRLHCIVRYDDYSGCFLLEDRSTNGTFLLSGDRAGKGETVRLKSGDRFFLSDISNLFEVRLEQ